VRQTPQTVNRVGPQHLIASDPMSMSAKIDHAKLKKEYTFLLGSYSKFISVRSICTLRPFIILKAASSTPYYSLPRSRSDLIRPLPVPPGMAPRVIVSEKRTWPIPGASTRLLQSCLFISPLTTSWTRPSPLTVMMMSYCPGTS
jgi:hypothetical protein